MIEDKELPIINISDNSLFSIDEATDTSKITKLIGKYIIFELIDKENKTLEILPGKLLDYKNGSLLIRKYDDGTDETKRLWQDNQENDLFKNFEEYVSVENIRGIEEYHKCDDIKYEEYKNCICEIIGNGNKKITVLISDCDGFEILFRYKYKVNNKEHIGEGSIPYQCVKSIKVVSKYTNENNNTTKKKIRFPDAIKNVTSYGKDIKGDITKICEINSKTRNVLLKGVLSDIKSIKVKEISIIKANLKDDTGMVKIIMLDKDKMIESKIKNNIAYQVWGYLNEEKKVIVKNINL